MAFTSAQASSSSTPTEAPVRREKRIFSPFLILSATASGTAFGYPQGVNPLVPMIIPSLMCLAASSAVVILDNSSLLNILLSIPILVLPPRLGSKPQLPSQRFAHLPTDNGLKENGTPRGPA